MGLARAGVTSTLLGLWNLETLHSSRNHFKEIWLSEAALGSGCRVHQAVTPGDSVLWGGRKGAGC